MFSLLYVDDEPGLLDIGQTFLENTGDFSVTTALSGRTALDELARHDFDAIVSDYQMPEMDGIEFLKNVRNSFGDIPFILFTGRGREEVVIEAINNGVDFYIQKGGDPSVQFAELAHKIRQAIGRRRAEVALSESEKRLADLINFLPDATFAINTQGVVIAWNRAMETMTGVRSGDILGKGDFEYALPFYHERRPLLINLVLADDPAVAAKYPFIKKEGKTLVSEITIPHFNEGRGAALWFTASPLYNKKGEVVGAIESIRDITERKRAEQALNESEQNYRLLFETSAEGILIAQGDRMVLVNPAMVSLIGYPADVLTSRPFTDFIHPDDRELVRSRHLRRMRGESPPTGYMFRVITQDGQEKWVWITSTRMTWSGKFASLSFLTDITERKKAEENLLSANREYTNLLDQIQDVYYRTDTDGRLVRASRSWATLFGYNDLSDCIGRMVADDFYVYPSDRKLFLEEIYRNGKVTNYEILLKKRDGTPVFIEASSHLYYDPAGNVIGIEGTFRDITGRKKAAEALNESERRFREHAELLPQGIFEADANGRFLFVNRLALEMSGYTREDIATGLNVLDGIVPEDRPRVAMVLRQMIEQGTRSPGNAEYTGLRKDGTTFPVSIYSSPILRDGRIVGVRGVFIDITEQKKAAEELRAANEQLVASDKELRTQYDELSQSEKRIRLSEARLTYMLGFYEYAQKSERELLEYAIEGAGIITGSPLGYLAFLNDDESELTMYAWSKVAMAECLMQEKPIVYKTEKTGLWGEAVRQRRPVITNDYAAPNPAKKGYPGGHPHIIRHMNVPVIDEGRVVLVAGVANKPSDYLENDANELLLFMQGLWTIIKRKRSQDELKAAYEQISASEEELRHQYDELAVTQEKLQRHQQQLEEIASTLPGVVYQFYARPDGSWGLYYVSSRAADVFGISNNPDDFFERFTSHVDPRDREAFLESIADTVKDGLPWYYEGRFIKPFGDGIWFEGISRPIRRGTELVYNGVLLDITGRKRAEEELRMLKISADQSADEVFWLDFEGNFLYVNDAACRINGYTRDEFLKMKIYALNPELTPGIWTWTTTDLRERKTQLFTTRHRHRDGSIIDVEIMSVYVNRDGKEYSFAFVRDITGRRRAEEALRESEAKFRAVIDQTFQFIGLLDTEGTLIEANRSALAFAGISESDVINRPFWETPWWSYSEELQEKLKHAILRAASGETVRFEAALRDANGNLADFDFSLKPVMDPAGRILYLIPEARDITGRKRAEDALRESEEKYRALVETTGTGFVILDDQGRVLDANPEYVRLTGDARLDEITGRSVMEWTAEYDRERNANAVRQCLRDGYIRDLEIDYTDASGNIIPIEINATALRSGDAVYVITLCRDISDRRASQAALRENEEKYRTLVENSFDGIAIHQDGIIVYINQTAARLLGSDDPGVFIGRSAIDMVAPAFRKQIAERMQQSKEEAQELMREQFLRLDGTPIDVDVTTTPTTWQGRPAAYVTFRDITAQLRTEEALEKRLVALTQPLEDEGIAFEDLFNLDEIQRLQDEFAKATGVAVLLTHPDGTPITKPSNFCRLCSEIVRRTPAGKERCYRSDSTLGALHEGGPFIHVCLSAGLWGAGANIVLGGRHIANWLIGQVRNETQTEEGMRAYAREIGVDEEDFIEAFLEVPIMSSEQFGYVAQSLYTLANQLSKSAYQNVQQARFITERNRTEEALRESEEKYRMLVEQSRDGVFIIQNGRLVFYNKALTGFSGYSTEELNNRLLAELVAPEDRETVVSSTRDRARGKEVPDLYEFSLLHKDNNRRIRVRVSAGFGTYKGRPASIGMLYDVTEDRRREEALRESEEKFRALVETTSDFIWEVDTEGKYTYVSPQVHRILGYEPEELTGKTPFDLMPPDEAERVAAEFNRYVTSRLPVVALENKALRKDGSVVILETSGVVHIAEDGSYLGYRGIDRDITARKQAEGALREKTEELNRYFTASLDLFCIADTSGYFRRLNPEWEKTLGYTLEELEGHRFLDFVHTDDLQPTLAAIDDLVKQKNVINFTNRYRHKDGTYRWIEWRSLSVGTLIFAAARDITARHEAAERTARISALKQELLKTAPLEEKLKRITDAVVDIFGADFARIWIAGAGDLCEHGCMHADISEGPHVCRDRTRCLHLIVSSGRYTHTDGGHRRVPFGAYKIGRIATGDEAMFITNDVVHDPQVHDHAWAESLGLTSFTGFRLVSPEGAPVGVLAFFSRQPIMREVMEDLDDLATTTSQVIQTDMAEQALRESEARLGSILHGSPVLQFVIDHNHRVISWNNALEEYSGIRAADMIGTDEQWRAFYEKKRPVLADLLVDGDTDAIARLYAGKLRKSRYVEGAFEATDFFPHMGSSGIWLSFTAAPIRDVQGTIIGAVETLEDVTERINAEKALRESNEWTRTILNTAQAGIILVDANTHRIVDANRKALELIGLDRDSVIGTVCYRFICPEEEGKCPVTDLNQEVDTSERVLLAASGDKIPVLKTVVRVSMGGRDILVESFVDISERKRSEEAIQEANRKLNLLNSITRHDIRNQLMVAQGYTQLAALSKPEPAVSDFLAKISAAVETIQRQIEFTKEYQELGVHAPAWFVVRNVIGTVRPEKIAVRNACNSVEIFADPMIDKVFYNLFDNAMKYGERVTTVTVGCRQKGDDLVITFADNGVGIPVKEKKKIFEKGYGRNTGFGLFLVREILAITGITIQETGKKGKGAVFEITVPKGAYRKAE